ncbi:MAG: HPr family phosphocarrier protein [Treponema sp.]|jgi:phosphocarrier protein|nr:HPr family phosphocarrier protein [Treponema sp.]
MVEASIVIENRAGIHARPAAMLVQTTKNFESSIYFEKGTDRINAKSIMGIITLGAAYGTVIKIVAEGKDEDAAMAALLRLFEMKFEEE